MTLSPLYASLSPQGSIAGLGLTLASVAVGALIFGAYGYGMFVVSPFVVGAATAYFGNRKQDIGEWRIRFLRSALLGMTGLMPSCLSDLRNELLS
jgi:hypothetical protein